jgi:pullulanase
MKQRRPSNGGVRVPGKLITLSPLTKRSCQMLPSIDGEYDKTMADLIARRETAFVLWHPTQAALPPQLVIGWLQPGTPLALIGEQVLTLRPVPGVSHLWELPAVECNLVDGWTYYYWFEVDAGDAPGRNEAGDRAGYRIRITDPLATAVDWRLLGPRLRPPFTAADRHPAAAIKFRGGRLLSADVGGEEPSFWGEPRPDFLPPNHRLVIYQLPTAWAQPGARSARTSSFRDVMALVDVTAGGATFDELEVTQPGRAYLSAELGVNAIQLASNGAHDRRRAASHSFAPDFELGFPDTYSWPAPNRDLAELSRTCHSHGIRFIADLPVVCADPAAYSRFADTYDPISGSTGWFSPARQLTKLVAHRWIRDFHVDGLTLSGLENATSWDFIQELKDYARLRSRERFETAGIAAHADERFTVMGDEAPEPQTLLEQRRIDGLWHEAFKHYIRMALVGRRHEHEPDFESTVRRAIDCRTFGYTDLSQAVIYLTSHDLDGFRNERLFEFFTHSGVVDAEKRTKLAFACLLTAVGLPMILAGEEFAQPHDPPDFSSLADDWRDRVRTCVSRLIKLRTTCDALAINDVEFIHGDFEDGKRVMAWHRGQRGSASQVVVIANFSDFTTPDASEPHAEYFVPNWPEAPPGLRWREVSQDRMVEETRVGREPLYAWEAKIYTLV